MLFFPVRSPGTGLKGRGQKIPGVHVLRSQDAIQGFERKLTAAVQEVGEMGLAESGLASQ